MNLKVKSNNLKEDKKEEAEFQTGLFAGFSNFLYNKIARKKDINDEINQKTKTLFSSKEEINCKKK